MAAVPLIRVEGKAFTSSTTLSAERFVASGACLLRDSKTDQTRKAEAGLELGDCLYFYAGHACPAFGDIVLIFNGEMLDAAPGGGATPFDTGGLYLGYVRAQGLDDPAARPGYCRSHTQPLSGWRSALDGYISRHFASPAAYVRGERPLEDDASGRLLHRENSRRAWTWEVRAHQDHPVFEDLIEARVHEDFFESLRQHVLGMSEPARSEWLGTVLGKKVVVHDPAQGSLHETVEKEVAKEL